MPGVRAIIASLCSRKHSHLTANHAEQPTPIAPLGAELDAGIELLHCSDETIEALKLLVAKEGVLVARNQSMTPQSRQHSLLGLASSSLAQSPARPFLKVDSDQSG